MTLGGFHAKLVEHRDDGGDDGEIVEAVNGFRVTSIQLAQSATARGTRAANRRRSGRCQDHDDAQDIETVVGQQQLGLILDRVDSFFKDHGCSPSATRCV